MPRVFSWEYFSFLQIDDTVMSKEMLAIPLILVVLVTVGMQLIRGQGKTGLNFEEAYNVSNAMSISPPTLKQLAAKIVVLKELPTAHLPKTVKEDFQAFTYLPGNFAVIEASMKVVGLDGRKLTTAEITEYGGLEVCDIGSKFTVSMTSNGINREWTATGPFLPLNFALDSKLVHTLADPAGGSHAIMTCVDGSGLVGELHTRRNDGKYVGKFTSSLMMKDMNTIVIKDVDDHLEQGIRAVITIVAQRE